MAQELLYRPDFHCYLAAITAGDGSLRLDLLQGRCNLLQCQVLVYRGLSNCFIVDAPESLERSCCTAANWASG